MQHILIEQINELQIARIGAIQGDEFRRGDKTGGHLGAIIMAPVQFPDPLAKARHIRRAVEGGAVNKIAPARIVRPKIVKRQNAVAELRSLNTGKGIGSIAVRLCYP